MTDETLAQFRQSIDNIDAALVFLLAERFRITKAVGRYKAIEGLPPAAPAREERQIARLRRLAHEAALDPEFSEQFLRFILHEVIRHHTRKSVDQGQSGPVRLDIGSRRIISNKKVLNTNAL